jgi:tetratricopeptide (TPR) repeat protein
MKRGKERIDAKMAGSRSPLAAGARSAFAILALAALCAGAVAADEKGADGWCRKSLEQYNNGSYEESLLAIDKAIELDPRNATLWAFKAQGLSTAGAITQNQSRFDESLQAYDRAIELEPRNTTYILWKGYAHRNAAYVAHGEERIRSFEKALAVFDKALQIDPLYSEAWSGKGVIYDDLATFGNDSTRYIDSLAAYERAIELAPSNDTRDLAQAHEGKAVALCHLSQCLAAQGLKEESRTRLEEAVKSYDRVIELDTEYIGQEALMNEAGALEELGRHDEAAVVHRKAIESLNRTIKESRNNSGAWAAKAILFREVGIPEAAVASLSNATEIVPEDVLAWEMTGDVLSVDLGRYEQSLAAYDQALQLDPAEARAWTGKGHALRSLGRSSEAVAAYDHALDVDPSLVEALMGKGAALRNIGQYNESTLAYDEALKTIQQGSRCDSQSRAAAEAWAGKAESLASSSRASEAAEARQQALQAYEKAAKIDPDSAGAWMGKGDALLGLDRQNESAQAYEKALEIINQSIERDPQDPEAWWMKAECLESLGRSEAALQAYDLVTDLNGSKALGAWIRKADILARLGRYNESLEAFDGALGLLPTEDKQSAYTELWNEDTSISYSAWLADGQILRTSSAWFNRTCGDFENIIAFSSDRVAAGRDASQRRPSLPRAGRMRLL